MGLHVRDFRSPSDQNQNAGNGGDLIKHSVYLALLDELRDDDRELHVVETHAGKGVYVPAAAEYAQAATDRAVRKSRPGYRARERVPATAGMAWDRLRVHDMASTPTRPRAVLHAFALRDLPQKSLSAHGLRPPRDGHVDAAVR